MWLAPSAPAGASRAGSTATSFPRGKPDGSNEDATSFLRADGLLGVIAFAGAVFVIAGVPPLGWALVGLTTLNLLMDGLADAAPLRRLLDRTFRPTQPE